MNIIRKTTLLSLVFGWGSLTSQGQIVQPPLTKKLVEFSHSSPTTRQYHDSTAFYDAGPFDGITVKLSDAVGGGNIFMVDEWPKVTPEAKQKEKEMMSSIAENTNLEHNFLVLYGASQMDWFSDEHWQRVEEQLRHGARLAKLGNFKGILWDPEAYKPGVNPWKYPEQTQADQYSYAEYYEQARKRGKQFIQAIQEEFPGLTIHALRGISDFQTGSPFSEKILPISEPEQARAALENAWWGLHLPFMVGILDEIDDDVIFVDGNEDAYYYTSALEYYQLRDILYDEALPLIPNDLHPTYRNQYAIGHAVSVDYLVGNWAGYLNGFSYRLSGQGKVLTPEERARWFEHNMYYALSTADEYAWLYSEEANWWSGRAVPEGFPEALQRAKQKVANDQPLGFSVEEMLQQAQDQAEKEFAKK